MTILGISANGTRSGLCLLQDGVLLDRHLHRYNDSWSANKLRIILNCYDRYIQKYEVSAIIVKIPPLHIDSPAVRQLVKRIEQLAKKRKCAFDLITTDEIKHRLGLRSTKELVDFAKTAYPELVPLYEKEKRSYYKKIFEAVLAAHIYQERQDARLF